MFDDSIIPSTNNENDAPIPASGPAIAKSNKACLSFGGFCNEVIPPVKPVPSEGTNVGMVMFKSLLLAVIICALKNKRNE